MLWSFASPSLLGFKGSFHSKNNICQELLDFRPGKDVLCWSCQFICGWGEKNNPTCHCSGTQGGQAVLHKLTLGVHQGLPWQQSQPPQAIIDSMSPLFLELSLVWSWAQKALPLLPFEQRALQGSNPSRCPPAQHWQPWGQLTLGLADFLVVIVKSDGPQHWSLENPRNWSQQADTFQLRLLVHVESTCDGSF